jgi:hypothetical protein
VGLANNSEGISENVVDGCLTAANRADSHETVAHKRCLVKLNDFDEPLGLFYEVVLLE